MLTDQDRAYHAKYEALPELARANVDRAVRAAIEALKQGGAPCAMDDRVEALVAAVARYLVESSK
jgi:hypothetical protein